jgi:sugar lactone lactonase YvrE
VIIDTDAGTGVRGFSGDGGPANEADLHRPFGVAVNAAGELYIADTLNYRVRKVDASGTISTVAGDGVAGFAGDGGPATSGRLNQPQGLAFDTAGNLYIADVGNQRVRKVDTGGTITTVAGSGAQGFAGDDGPAVDAAFQFPVAVTVDADGDLFIADQNNHRIRKVDPAGTITTVAGTGVAAYSGDGGPATSAQLNAPRALDADADGNLYVADTFNHRIRRVDTTGTITTYAGSGIGAFYGDGGPATSAGLQHPRGLEMTAAGVLVIADTNNAAVRAVLADGSMITLAGYACAPNWPPCAGFDGDGDVPTEAMFDFPQDVAADADGVLYIADERNDRVRKIYPGGGAVGGRVVADDGGASAAGLTVNLYATSDLGTPVATTTTNAHGFYGFSVLVGDYTVEVEGGAGFVGEWYADAPDGASATTVVVDEGDQERVDLSLAS